MQSFRLHISQLFGSRFALISAGSWVTSVFMVQQGLRLVTGITLAWLLAPELLGTMLLINALRTAGELLSDVGIGQSIIKDKHGDEPTFYRTAWTIQIARGVLIFLAALLLTPLLADIYEAPELNWLIPITATVFIVSGFASPATYLLQKKMELRRISFFSIGSALASSVIHIGLALYTPTIWALVGGLLISNALVTVASFFLLDWRIHALAFDVRAAKAILEFGKWIFLSSLIYFAAMNFDKLYFAGAVPLAILGVYGVARTFADALTLLFQRLGSFVIFPKVAGTSMDLPTLRLALLPVRRTTVIALAITLSVAVVFSDVFILLAYDERYHAAGVFLPILLIGTWFSILAAIADAIAMGIGRPSSTAFANAAKLLFIVLIVPQVLSENGMIAAVAIFALAELVRYGVLTWRKRVYGLSFLRQDMFATFLFFTSTLMLRQVTGWLSITGGLPSWAEALREAVG